MTIYTELSKVPTLKSAEINHISSDFISTKTLWNVRDDVKNDSNDIQKVDFFDLKQDKLISSHKSVLTSYSSKESRILWDIKDDAGNRYVCQEFSVFVKNPKLAKVSPKEGTFISIFNSTGLVKSIQILDPTKIKENQFKKVIPFRSDPSCPFSSAQVSKDSSKIVFSVEANQNELPFEHVQNYGELLNDMENPTVAIFDLNKERITKVIPVVDKTFGQAVWTPDSKDLILVCHFLMPIKEGLAYCHQRRSPLVHYKLDSDQIKILSQEQNSARCPRFSPNGKFLVWLDMFIGGPHFQCQRLQCLKWNEDDSRPVCLIPIIDYPLDNGFPGIYNPMGLPFSCWTEDSRFVVFSTKWSFSHTPVMVNVEKYAREEEESVKAMKKSPPKSPLVLPAVFGPELKDWTSEKLISQDISIIEVKGSTVLAKVTSLLHPHAIGILRLPLGDLSQEDLNKLKWTRINYSPSQAEEEIQGVESIRFWTRSSLPMNINDLNVFDFESTLVKLNQGQVKFNSLKGSAKVKGLIVVIHGGPHSAFFHSWSATLAAFLLDGYSLLMPNYRGSIGYGDASVRCLPGHIGTADVTDCIDSLKQCQDKFLSSDVPVYLYGGSHGGFLTCHLAGRFPDIFSGALALNPVTELLGMAYSSDIPDWAFVESNTVQFVQQVDTDYTKSQREQQELDQLTNSLQPRGQCWFQGQVVNKGKQFEIMAKMSPLSYVTSQWSVPIYVFLGDSDLRVPNWQGRVFYQKVKSSTLSKNLLCKLFMYPNQGHRLDGVVESEDIYTNCIDLFNKSQLSEESKTSKK